MSANNRVALLNYDIDCDMLKAEIPFLLKNAGLSVYGYNTFTHHFWGKVVNRGACVFSVFIQLKKGGLNGTIVTIDAEIYDDLLMKSFIADFKKEISYIIYQRDMFVKFNIKINSRVLPMVASR